MSGLVPLDKDRGRVFLVTISRDPKGSMAVCRVYQFFLE